MDEKASKNESLVDRYYDKEARLELMDLAFTVQELITMLKTLGRKISHEQNRKTALCRMAEPYFSSPERFSALLEAIGSDAAEILSSVVWDGCMNMDYAAELYDLEKVDYGHYYYGPQNYILPAGFILKSGHEEIYISPNLHLILRLLIPRPEIDAGYFDNGIPGEHHPGMDEEETMYEELDQLIFRLEDSGFFKRTADQGILKSHMNLAGKNLSLTPFESMNPDGKLQEYRIPFILKFLSFSANGRETGLPASYKLIQEGLHDYFTSDSTTLDLFFLPHIRFRNKSGYLKTQMAYRKKNFYIFRKILENWIFDDWVDFDAVYKTFRYSSLLRPLFFHGIDLSFDITESDDYDEDHKRRIPVSSEGIYNDYVFLPYLNHLFFMLAALGLFELAWNEYMPEYEGYVSYMKSFPGRISTVRMTEAGKRMFSQNPQAPAPLRTKTITVELDKKHLIAHVSAKNSASYNFFDSFARKLGNQTFIINAGMIRKKCPTIQDMEGFFSSLERYHGEGLPENWLVLKRDVLACYIRVPVEMDWLVYRFTEEQQEALAFLRQSSPALYHFLDERRVVVHKDNIRKFRNHLSSGGFALLPVLDKQ